MGFPKIIVGFATTNAHKLRETEQCFQQLDPSITVMPLTPLEDVAETGSSFEENALIKVHASLSEPLPAEVTHVMAEDAGLIVDALSGYLGFSPFPGIYSHRWFSQEVQQSLYDRTFESVTYEQINDALLKLLTDKENRSARYEACVACWERASGAISCFTGTVPLSVAYASSGEGGFGYDPIMIPVTYDPNRTMAQLRSEEKNAISHRYQALQQLAAWLSAGESKAAAPASGCS